MHFNIGLIGKIYLNEMVSVCETAISFRTPVHYTKFSMRSSVLWGYSLTKLLSPVWRGILGQEYPKLGILQHICHTGPGLQALFPLAK